MFAFELIVFPENYLATTVSVLYGALIEVNRRSFVFFPLHFVHCATLNFWLILLGAWRVVEAHSLEFVTQVQRAVELWAIA